MANATKSSQFNVLNDYHVAIGPVKFCLTSVLLPFKEKSIKKFILKTVYVHIPRKLDYNTYVVQMKHIMEEL